MFALQRDGSRGSDGVGSADRQNPGVIVKASCPNSTSPYAVTRYSCHASGWLAQSRTLPNTRACAA